MIELAKDNRSELVTYVKRGREKNSNSIHWNFETQIIFDDFFHLGSNLEKRCGETVSLMFIMIIGVFRERKSKKT